MAKTALRKIKNATDIPQQAKGEKPEVLLDMDIAKEVIEAVRGEWRTYDNALVFVTDRVAFNVRALIKTLRKNYWGIFDNEKDPVSNQKMTWIPLTEWIVDTFVKNADRDQKDVRVKAKKTAYVGLAMLVRNLITNWMDDKHFWRGIGRNGTPNRH
jgi:hypothetical protein